MIVIPTTLTGYQVGEALSEDLEELAYCLTELSSDVPVSDFWEIADCIRYPKIVDPTQKETDQCKT